MDLNDGHKWMSFLPDDVKLNNLTIPGTHDSCAYDCNPLAKCQKNSLSLQLNFGIRYIDVRCRHIKDQFKLYHSSFDLCLDFDTGCIDVCLDFLNKNPTECIIVLVSPENQALDNKLDFDDVFLRYIHKSRDKWYLDEDCPQLGNCRGKIVLFRRFFSVKRPLGIDMSGWRHDGSFNMKNHSNFGFLIQDIYNLKSSQKWSKIKELLDLANSNLNDKDTWYLNYCSAHYWPIQPPIYIAWKVNKNLRSYLRNESFLKIDKNESVRNLDKYFNLGIIVMDFADKDLISLIFGLNIK